MNVLMLCGESRSEVRLWLADKKLRPTWATLDGAGKSSQSRGGVAFEAERA